MSAEQKIRVAVLGSYTINNIQKPLEECMKRSGLDTDIRFGAYNQFIQELMDESSWLNEFKPNVIFIALSTKTFLSDIEHSLIDSKRENLSKFTEQKLGFIEMAVSSLKFQSKIIITNLDVPIYSPYKLIDLLHENSLKKAVSEFNDKLVELSKRQSNLFVMDFDSICSRIGKDNMTDDKMYYLGKIILGSKIADEISIELSTIINAIYGRVKKCLVVDLDNTLWGGVVGEDGPHGIQIGDSNIGKIYEDIQKILLNYKKLGVLLAVVSKNNVEDVEEVFSSNKNMILKRDDFVAKRVNWNLKSQNIKEIAEELNIGLDSMVFLDDNPAERLEVKTNLPMVEVIDFPSDIAKLPKTLSMMRYFNSLSITEEDMKRSEMYIQEKGRESLKSNVPLEDYLGKLGIAIEVKRNDKHSTERINQLINKTNQFNLRTQRYTIEQVKEMIESDNHIVSSLKVRDNFGELGLTGIIILKIEGRTCFIQDFLMSCRILSRRIEDQFLLETLEMLKGRDIHEIRAEYIPTKKNEIVKGIYETYGFTVVSDEEGIKKYKAPLNSIKLKSVNWIKVEKDG